MKQGEESGRGGVVRFSVHAGIVLAGATAMLALAGCGAPDVPSKWGGGSGATGQPAAPPPPPYHQVDDMSPPTGLAVTTTGGQVTLSWTPPTPAPRSYVVLWGLAADAQDSTFQITAGTSVVLSQWSLGWPRGRPFFVALASYRAADNAHSAASGAVQVTMPLLEPGTLQVDCSVPHVNDGPYRAVDGSFQGTFAPGSCVRGTFRDLDMSTAFDRTYGASYTVDGVGHILDLGVLQGQVSTGYYDDAYPALRFLLSPASSVTTGSSWKTWVDAIGPGEAQLLGSISYLGWGSTCLHGLATAGTLTVTSATGLDAPGTGAFRIQGSVTFSDPYGVPGLCEPPTCCL